MGALPWPSLVAVYTPTGGHLQAHAITFEVRGRISPLESWTDARRNWRAIMGVTVSIREDLLLKARAIAAPLLKGDEEAIAGATPSERVVLIPCSASSALQWNALVQSLDRFQAVPIDLCGHGEQRPWHGNGPLSLSEEVAVIADACEAKAPFHLIGH